MTFHAKDTLNNLAEFGDIDFAATLIPFKKSTIYRFCCEEKIPHFKKGGKLLFSRTDLFKWLTENRRLTIDEIKEAAIVNFQRSNTRASKKVRA